MADIILILVIAVVLFYMIAKMIKKRNQNMDDIERINNGTIKVNQPVKSASERKREQLRFAKDLATILGLSIVGIVRISTFDGLTLPDSHKNISETETLNYYDNDNYVLSNYQVVGDGTIFEHDGLSIKITGFYEQQSETEPHSIKVEFTLENNTKEDQRIMINPAGINHVTNTSLSVYDDFGPGNTVFYETVYNVSAISEICFSSVSMESTNHKEEYKTDDLIYVKTNAELNDERIEPQGTLIYSSDLSDVYTQDTEDHTGYNLYILNKSDTYFRVECDHLRIDGEKIENNIIFNTLPAGYLDCRKLFSNDERFDGYENKKVEISIWFECKKDPSLNFSTGYIELK